MKAQAGGSGDREGRGKKEEHKGHLAVEKALNQGLFIIERFPKRPRDLEDMQGALLVADR